MFQRRKWMLAAMAVAGVITVSPLLGSDFTTDSLATVRGRILMNQAVLIDVRERNERMQAHIAGSISLPLSELENGLSEEELLQRLPRNRILYVHCRVGRRAILGGEILREFGYDARPLKARVNELVQAGFELIEEE